MAAPGRLPPHVLGSGRPIFVETAVFGGELVAPSHERKASAVDHCQGPRLPLTY